MSPLSVDESNEVEPPGHILNMLMSIFQISDIDMGEAVGLSRQVIQKRRRGNTPMSARDLVIFAGVLAVPRELFLGTAAEAVRWVVDNQPERLAPASDNGEGGEPVKLRPLADVVQWNHADITTLSGELPQAA